MGDTQWKQPGSGLHIGIYGWRKRCLYLVLLALLCAVALNLTLVLWLMNVLHFDMNGMSYMQMVGSSVQFTGKAIVQDYLVSSGLETRARQGMTIESARNLTLNTSDRNGHIASNIFIGSGAFSINTPSFKVTDIRGKTLFSVDKDTVSLTANSLYISGDGGAVFEGSMKTPIVSADIRSDLKLESATEAVQAVTPAGVSIESRAGDILASSHHDITLITVDGSMKLESTNVLLPSLRQPQSSHDLRKHHHHTDRIFQLCVCANGELYLGDADKVCDSSAKNEICR